MLPQKVTDDELVEAVRRVRAEHGVCTYTLLVAASGLSRGRVYKRVQRLVTAGRLLAGRKGGAIRLP